MLGGRNMIKKFAQGGKIQYEISKWAVDTEADLTNIKEARMGDIAFVIQKSESWMLDSNSTWYNVTDATKDPIKCDCVSELTIWGELPEPTV